MTPQPITPQPQPQPQQDPEVLKARANALAAQLVALDAARDADQAVAAFNYLQKKSNLLKLKQQTADQLAQLASQTSSSQS